jgi:hypothetical protein
VAAFARAAKNGGLIVTPSGQATFHRELIITLAARHRLPAVYPFRFYVTGGGLISYGPDLIEPFRRAAGYVDRILKGEKPADLPVQATTKYELAINLKAAKPKSASACVNAERRVLYTGSFSSPDMSTPMRRTRSPCCARAARGQAAALPSKRALLGVTGIRS